MAAFRFVFHVSTAYVLRSTAMLCTWNSLLRYSHVHFFSTRPPLCGGVFQKSNVSGLVSPTDWIRRRDAEDQDSRTKWSLSCSIFMFKLSRRNFEQVLLGFRSGNESGLCTWRHLPYLTVEVRYLISHLRFGSTTCDIGKGEQLTPRCRDALSSSSRSASQPKVRILHSRGDVAC
jgi:hypothetical protein